MVDPANSNGSLETTKKDTIPALKEAEWNAWLVKYQSGLHNERENLTASPLQPLPSPSTGPQFSLGDMMVRDSKGQLVSSLDFFIKEGYLASPPAISRHRRLRDLALLRHNLDQTFGNTTLDAHCQQTKALFRAPFSAISLAQIDPDFLQIMGANGCGLEDIVNTPLPRSASICAHTFLLGERCAVILNRSKDWRLKNFQFGPHPDYHEQPPLGFNFYASAPLMLTAPSNHHSQGGSGEEDVKVQVGRLCVLDFDAREEFGEVETTQLQAMANMASDTIQRKWESQRAKKLMQMQTYTNQLNAAFHSTFIATEAQDEDEDKVERRLQADLQSLFQLSCEQILELFGAAGVVCFGPSLNQERDDQSDSTKSESTSDHFNNGRGVRSEANLNSDNLRRNSLLSQGDLIGVREYMARKRKGESQVCICASAGRNAATSAGMNEEQENAIESWLDKHGYSSRADQRKIMLYRSAKLRRAHANRYDNDTPNEQDYEAEDLACLLSNQDTSTFLLAPITTMEKKRGSYAILIHWTNETLFEEWDRNFILSSISILQSACIRKSAIQSDNARLNFMRLVSHELRTPLHGIIGMSSQLQHALGTEGFQNGGSNQSDKIPLANGEAAWLSKSIQYAGEDLQKMLEDMLICGRSSVGLPTSTISPSASDTAPRVDTRLSQVLESTCQKLLLAHLRRKIHTDVDHDATFDSLPLIMIKLDVESEMINLQGHVDKVEVALHQFISNALRFSKQTSTDELSLVEISVGPVQEDEGCSVIEQHSNKASVKLEKEQVKRGENDDDRRARVQITIRDNGIGMSESFLEHFAEPFKKADEFHQGAGVGAAVGISSLNELGGSVSVSSTLGQGTSIKMIIKGKTIEEDMREVTIPRGGRLSCAVVSKVKNETIRGYLEKQFALRYIQLEERDNDHSNCTLLLYFMDQVDEASMQDLKRVSDSLTSSQRLIVATILLEQEIKEVQQSINLPPSIHYFANPWGPSALASLDSYLDNIRSGESSKIIDYSRTSSSNSSRYVEYSLTKTDNTISSPLSSPTTSIMSKSIRNARHSTAPPIIIATDQPIHQAMLPPLRKISSPSSFNATLPQSDNDDEFSVLLVEDNPINMRLLEACVKKIKCHYQKAFDGIEAVSKYKEMSKYGGPSIVLLDISLPFMDGLQACKLMRGHDSSVQEIKGVKRARVVAVTALSSEEDMQRGVECGVDEWRVKPANLPKLTTDLKGWQANWKVE